MDDLGTLHIRCGSDIEPALREAGFTGGFLDFSDPFCQGPVRDLPAEAFLQERGTFVAEAYGLDPADVFKKQRLRYARLANAAASKRIVLWFEHDSYDQLILAYLLNHFGGLEERPEVELVCIDDYPVEPRFMGLGQLGPDALKEIWEGRQPVSDAQYKLGAAVWDALREAAPHNLVRLVQTGTPALPVCAGALKRHLQELPARGSGLSLTEELTLKLLAEAPMSGGKLFGSLCRTHEPLPYLGDLMYWYDLRRLIEGGAIRQGQGEEIHQREMTITDLGHACLKGEADWMAHVAGERYVGGIRVAPDGSKVWRRQG